MEQRDLVPARMRQLVDEMFTQKFGTAPAGAAFLLKRQIQHQLEVLLTEYQQPTAEESEIIIQGLEEKIFIETLGAKFEGRLDRIEQRDGKIVILDYKTGPQPSTPLIHFGRLNLNSRESWSESIISLQLPMYLMLYQVRTKTAIDRIIPAYLYLGNNKLGKECEVAFMEDAEERATCFKQIQQVISLLLEEINTAKIPFSPPADLSKTCPRCPYTGLCGTKWVQGWSA